VIRRRLLAEPAGSPLGGDQRFHHDHIQCYL
jgi:hypothetical protein